MVHFPDAGADLALRLALFHSSSIIKVTAFWIHTLKVEEDPNVYDLLKKGFLFYLNTLHKQLNRVKKIKIWIEVKHLIKTELVAESDLVLNLKRK